ncbi:ubiquitin-like domain-containing C-terminal domain phosphatase 1 [Oratosquilla oratoria]|uniref:ubiquitin-like domain-containing C-terminal domain phosphatase 1 n=1 Tax=Oratosquilla oratoria TaxID=337810 RepID=UPI003F75B847
MDVDTEAFTVVNVKWSGKEYPIKAFHANTLLHFKNAVCEATGVLPERQKLLNLRLRGKAPADDTRMKEFNLQTNAKIMMMGSREEAVREMQEVPKDLPEVVNDLDIEEEVIAIEQRQEYLQKIEKRVKDYEIKMLNDMRPGKKLLVLDIDYTLFDHRSVAETGNELMRPFLHEFLTSAYEDYDIVIWSATSMKWIEEKMKLLGVSTHPNYKIAFYLDSLAMITIHTEKYGVIEVKPLGVVWGKYEHYTSKNTIMFDDLSRNFLMNPQNGLKIRPFRLAHFNRDTDKELQKLSHYLKDIAALDDLSSLNHGKWEKYKKPH